MRQLDKSICWLRLATWVVAGALLLGASELVAAETYAPALRTNLQVFDSVGAFAPAALGTLASDLIGGESTGSAMPAGDVGPGLVAGETGPVGLGALVGAGVAAAYALRERFKNR